MIEKVNSFIEKNIILIFTIFLFMQPVLDAITGIVLIKSKTTFTFSAIIRVLFLVFSIYYLLFINGKKYKKILYILFIYCISFLITNFVSKPISNIVLETKYLLNNIYLPILLIFVFSILENNKIEEKNLFRILIIYLLLILIPDIFDIGFNSYAYSKTGSVGFFYSANAIGNIISIISPLLISHLIKNKKILYLLCFLGIYFYILLTLGTKAPILCAGIVFIYYLILYIVKMFKNKKYVHIGIVTAFVITFIVILVNILPSTPFYKNIIIHLNFLKIKKLSDLLTFKNIDHFIFSSRLSFFSKEFNLFSKANIFQKLFGIGYINNNKIMKIAEMDYLDTFIHQGIIGFIVIYFSYFKFLFNIFKGYFKNFKKNFFDMEKSSVIILIIISILCAFLTGHVLSTPSVSIFVALLIVISYNNICERGK